MKQNLLFNQASALGKRLAMVLTMLLVVGVGSVYGQTTTTYTFSSKSWAASPANWTSGKDGNQMQSGRGIQVTTGASGANATSPISFTNVSKIVVTYSTNASAGAGSIKIKIGSNTEVSQNVTKTGGTTDRTLTYNFSPNQTGSVKVTVTCSTNSIYIKSIAITEAAPAVNHTVTWKVNGENYTTGSPSTSVSGGSQVTKLPTNPTLDCSGKTFVGWSNEEVTDGSEPDVLFTTAENSPAITKPTTFHAVFATKGANQTATFDAATISGLTKSSSSLTWTHNTSGIELYLSAGQRYTSGTPNTFTVTSGTSNYCQLSAPTGIVMSKVVATLSGTNYKINSVSTPWTLSTSSTIQTISSTNGSDYLKMSATSSYQIRITQLVVTYATYSDYTTTCTTETVVTLHPNGGAVSEDGWETTDGEVTYTKTVETTSAVTLPIPTKDGYEFGGWYENSGFTGSAVTAVLEGTEGEKTYYAKWNCIAPTSVTVTPTNENGWRYSIGETISLEATATGGSADAYSYQWQKFIESAWEDIDGATSQVYTKECGTGDGGTYRCVVSTGDDCSTESNVYWVRVFTLVGNFNSNSEWNDEKIIWSTEDNQHTIGTVTLTLPANATYEFKVADNDGRWFGNPGIINATTDWWGFGVDDDNCTLQTKQAGEYIFTIDVEHAGDSEGTYVNVKVTFPTTQIIYFKPATSGTWADDAKFTIYSWGSGDPSYTPLQDKDCGGIYSAEISTTHTSLLFIKASTYKENFENITAQTIDLTAPTGDKVLYDMTSKNITHLYFVPSSQWKNDNARFAAYFFNNSGNTWASMSDSNSDGIFECSIPKGYTGVIFCRMNGNNTTNDWNNKYNQSGDLTIPTDGKNLLTPPSDWWDSFTGTWSTRYDDSKWTTYTPNHTVSFDANGHGTAPEDQCITDGGTATNPGNLSATGYTFGGWYKEAGCTNAWNFAIDVVTSDITLYAKWTANIHTLMWDVNGGNDLTGTYTSGSVAYGTVITKPADPTRTGHTFMGWKETDGSTTIAETMPDKDLTYTAQWEEIPSYIVTYSVGNGDTAPEPAVVEPIPGSSIELPSLETDLTCVKFVGWTDADNDADITSSNIYKAGDSYEVTQDITLKAVYAAVGGFVLVTDASELAIGDHIVIAAAGFDVAMGADKGNNRDKVEVTKNNTDKTITTPNGIQILTLEAGTVTEDANSNPIITYAFNTGSGYLYAASSSSNYLKTHATNNANGSWTISIDGEGIATIKAKGSYTRNWLRYNSGSGIFSCYSSGQSDVSIYKESITGYTTDPECEMYNVTLCTPTNGTISVDKTIVDPYGFTILTFTPASGYMLDAVLVTSGNAEVGTVSYTSNQTSDGTVKISNIQSDIEVCATFKAIPFYKVTFIDMNADPQNSIEVFQSEFGGDITAPATASDGCDVTWTFIGWAPSNSLNGTTEEPANLIEAGGTISGANITNNNLIYYSVYSNGSDGTPPFSIGKSGTYYMYALDGSTKYYATTKYDSNTLRSNNTNFESYPKATFKLDFDSNNSKYKIKVTTNTSEGYLYQPDTNDKELILDDDLSNYSLFTIINGSETESYRVTYSYYAQESKYVNGQWVTESVLKTGNFGMSSQKFAGRTNGYDVYFEPASEMHYYNASDCSTDDYVTMSFHNPFGSSKAQLQYEVGYEEDYYTNTSKKYVDVFPTLEYAGWTFIGWTAGTPYNDVIGEDNLNDENSSAYAPTQDIYKTGGGLSYYLGGDVTMYPVFTKFEDNEPFDMINGGDYYIYYIADGDIGTSVDEYGAAQRIYAAEYDDYGFRSTQSCADATLFTFTKLPDGKWTIYDNTRNKYVYGVNNDNKLEDRAQTGDGKEKFIKEWSIEVINGNQVNAVCAEGCVLSAYSQDATTGTFKNYDEGSFRNNTSLYHRVYIGTCTERVYSSNPSNKPAITLSGEPLVTSTQDQSIRAQGELSISATKLAANGTITLTSDNEDVYFSTVKDANFTQATKPLASLPLNADEKGKLAMTTVYVHYKPTSTSSLGVQTANITATTGTEGEEDYATAETTAHVRNLPADFVIAAKWGDNWYAMPANMDSQSSTEGWLIEVDDAANPTKAIAAPNTTKYGLKSVYTSNSTADRYADNGERLVFVENVTEATPITKTLYNGGDGSSSKTNIQVYAQYANYYSDQNQAPRYEWIPTTTDLTDYTLTSGAILTGDAVGRTVSLDNHGVFGTLLQDKSYNGMVRLLPVDNFYEPIELQVVEWKQNSVSVMYTGAGTKYTTKVGKDDESSVQELSSIDHAVYELTTSDLTTATNQPLIITIKDNTEAPIGAIKLIIPAIVATDKSSTALGVAEENAKATNIVILDGATLTAGTTKYTYNDVVVYPGGNLVIDTDGKLGMYTLTLRAGSSWGAAEYEHKYPQFLLKGDYSNTSGQINLDYVTTADYYYPLSVPEEVTIIDIKYPVDIYGSNVDKANRGSFRLKYYDGKQRVDQGSQYGTGWVVVNENTTTTLEPNQGYAIWGIPKKINGTRQTYGIHRIPIKKAASDLITNETTTEEIAITAHGDASTPPNDRGWNYLGNPYLAGLGTNDDTDVQMGLLVQEMIDGKWTGGWVNNGEQVRYVTLTKDCQNFEALPVSEATILPFTTFFVQAAQTGAIALNAPTAVAAPASVVARRYAAQQETAKEITTGILLTGNDQTDRTGLLIADNFTEEYDYNADLSKFENSGINLYTIGKTGNLAYMAINQALAEQPIPVGYTAPAEGLYTIAFDEDRYNATDISALYLIDYDSNEKTNLLHTDYSFVTAAGTNNQRFALQVAFAPENATNVEWVGDATIQVGVEGNTLMLNNLPTDAAVHVFDALGRLMYHAPTVPTEMQLTLPTGYYLVRIADKQHAVVIKTVIP